MKKYAFHAFASIFPLLPESELSALADDIRKNELREPAYLYDGKVLDGRNRARACIIAGVPLRDTRIFRYAIRGPGFRPV